MGSMDCGGIETWLMQLLRHMDTGRFHMDFLVHTSEHCACDDEINELGSRVIPCPGYNLPLRYARNFKRAVDDNGPYDIVHSHVHYFSGFVLRVAGSAGVQKLVAHSHTDALALEDGERASRRLYVELMKRMVSRYAVSGLAASRGAAEDLFGPGWNNDPRWQLLYCGIDLEPFKETVNPRQIRAELGLPQESFIVGHVGRFSVEKNHAFIIDIASELRRIEAGTYFLLVGDGPTRKEIEHKAENLGLRDRVRFTGFRTDVTRLMLGAMDAMILPSHREGLPLVLIEAQAAGLPCICSEVVTEETDVVKRLIRRLPSGAAVDAWVTSILELQRNGQKNRDRAAVKTLEHSPFNILSSAEELTKIYEGLDGPTLKK